MSRVSILTCICILILATLQGCTDNTSTNLWHDYSQRIGNIFDTDINVLDFDLLVINIPDKKQRQQTLSPPSISLLQFLKLYQCPVNSLVAKRNGPLGKVMLPSQIFIYISEFIPLAQQCLETEKLSAENADALKQAIAFYQANKHIYFANALFHDEFSKLFHAAHFWPMGEHFSANGVEGLNYWLTLQEQLKTPEWPNTPLDDTLLESSLNTLQQGQQIGHWLQEIHLASQSLVVLTEAMNQHKGLCVYSQQSIKKTALVNVFRLWFSQQVQPWISQLNRFGQSLEKQLSPLMAQHPTMGAFHQRLFIHKGSPWVQFQTHWREHVRAWQRHLNQCQSMPGQAS
jgi:hypothetical protein